MLPGHSVSELLTMIGYYGLASLIKYCIFPIFQVFLQKFFIIFAESRPKCGNPARFFRNFGQWNWGAPRLTAWTDLTDGTDKPRLKQHVVKCLKSALQFLKCGITSRNMMFAVAP